MATAAGRRILPDGADEGGATLGVGGVRGRRGRGRGQGRRLADPEGADEGDGRLRGGTLRGHRTGSTGGGAEGRHEGGGEPLAARARIGAPEHDHPGAAPDGRRVDPVVRARTGQVDEAGADEGGEEVGVERAPTAGERRGEAAGHLAPHRVGIVAVEGQPVGQPPAPGVVVEAPAIGEPPEPDELGAGRAERSHRPPDLGVRGAPAGQHEGACALEPTGEVAGLPRGGHGRRLFHLLPPAEAQAVSKAMTVTMLNATWAAMPGPRRPVRWAR